jgi:hypothetical protein
MTSWKPFSAASRLLVFLNAALCLLLLAAGIAFFRWGGLQTWLQQQVQSRLVLESQRLLDHYNPAIRQTEQNLRLLADLAETIFSHPESYRLSPQPGQYDFDKESGVYCSLASDDPVAVVLSSASSLTPELLRDIRLAEYLAQPFKSASQGKGYLRQITLTTADSLVVSYPWVNYPALIKGGSWKRDFDIAGLDYYQRAAPARNPDKRPVWLWVEGAGNSGASLVCAVPLFVNEQFKAVLSMELSFAELASAVALSAGLSADPVVFLDDRGRIVAISLAARSLLEIPPPLTLPIAPGQLPAGRGRDRLAEIARQAKTPGAAAEAGGFNVQGLALVPVQGTMIVMVAEGSWLAPSALWPLAPENMALLAGLSSLAFLAVLNCWWMLSARKKLRSSPQRLAESMAALKGLEQDKELICGQEGEQSEVYQRFDNSLERVRQALGALEAGGLPEGMEKESWKETFSELEILTQRVRLLMDFSVIDSIDSGLSKLSQLLADLFSATNACFLFYSPGERQFQSHNGGVESGKDGPERIVISVAEGSFLDIVLNTQQPAAAQLSDLGRDDHAVFASLAASNILAGPLFYRKEVFGIILLADKKGAWSEQDQRRLEALEDTLSRIVNNLVQSDRYRRIDLLRREYCMELSKAVEIPLHHIKEEVQSIHARLGRLTPYFKEHCESILFEVGVLYQIAQEARDQEADRAGSNRPRELPAENEPQSEG